VLAIRAVTLVIVASDGITGVVGFSAFAVLAYYANANAGVSTELHARPQARPRARRHRTSLHAKEVPEMRDHE
jgi:hypothetical protein